MKRRLLVTILIILIALSITTNALAQDYYFHLDKEVVNAYWNTDGTLSLDYLLAFTNQLSGHSIEYVDMGMPTSNFSMSTAKAEVNGQAVSVSKSDYQGSGSGFAVVLGANAIQPGQSGTVHVYVGRVSDVLYKDDNDSNYVSAVFEPNYFGSQYVTGNTDLTVTFHLPPGLQENDPRWHNAPSGFPSQPQAGFDQNNRVTYTWNNPNANAAHEYQFGASFPKSVVPNAVIVQPPTSQAPQTDLGSAFGLIILICVFGFIFIVTPILAMIAGSRRKLQYLPPRISIEGHGIKRGLTAVEAAILMEQPLDKVMTMILFGAIKKNAATVTSRDPLKLSIASPLPEDLHDYELNFLNAFKENDLKDRGYLLQNMTVKLVKSVSEKMKGFSRNETIDYYKSIMEKAWAQVEQAATPEVKGQLFDQNLEWTMLDREYDQRTRRVFTGPIFVPMWWGRYDPVWHGGGSTFGGGSTPVSTSSGRSGSSALPGADFAASVVGGVQTFSSKVIGNVQDFTSRVTNLTNPPPPPPARASGGSRGGGGGRSCACACACAGCACACAGGGR
jgi:hypothetical protein